jgi:hypothetical protein
MNLEKVALDQNFSLSYGASTQKRIYGLCYESFQNENLKDQLHYEVEIQFLEDNYGANRILEIDRRQVYINNKVPNSKMEQIAEKASQTIFPLRIKMKANGEIEEILTNSAIKKRWFSAKEEILNYYKGETIYKVVNKIESVILNEDLLKKSIYQNWFFHLYFKPFYTQYTEKLKFKYIWDSPVFGNQYIKYGVVHTLNEHYDQDDKIDINANGIAVDERSIEEIIEGYNFPKALLSGEEVEPVESTMNVDYKLYKEDRSIFSVTGTFETKINKNTQQKIQIEIFHFPETSSFRPWSDFALKENKRIFQSYQNNGDDDIIDIVEVSKRLRQDEKPQPERILGTPRESVQFYVPDESDPVAKTSFWGKIKSGLKTNK